MSLLSVLLIEHAALEELQANPQAVFSDLALDLGPGLSFGTVCGFASGFTLKKAGKVAVVVRLSQPSLLLSRPLAALFSHRRLQDSVSLTHPPAQTRR